MNINQNSAWTELSQELNVIVNIYHDLLFICVFLWLERNLHLFVYPFQVR